MTIEEFNQLSVGDEVRVVDNPTHNTVSEFMIKSYAGKLITIDTIEDNGIICKEGWYWHYTDFQLITDVPTAKPTKPELTYQIVADNYRERVSEQVSKLLQEGWELYGNPYNTPSYAHNQALIKPKNHYKELQNETN